MVQFNRKTQDFDDRPRKFTEEELKELLALVPRGTPPDSPQPVTEIDTLAGRIAEFEGGNVREGSPFARQTPRQPLESTLRAIAKPAEVSGAITGEIIALERAAAEKIGIPGRGVDPLDLASRSAFLELQQEQDARRAAGFPPQEIGFGDITGKFSDIKESRNLGQNLLLEVGSDPLNIVPGVGFTQLGRRVPSATGAFRFTAPEVAGRSGGLAEGPAVRQLAPEQIPPSVRPEPVADVPTVTTAEAPASLTSVDPDDAAKLLSLDDRLKTLVTASNDPAMADNASVLNALLKTSGERNKLAEQLKEGLGLSKADSTPDDVVARLRSDGPTVTSGDAPTSLTSDLSDQTRADILRREAEETVQREGTEVTRARMLASAEAARDEEIARRTVSAAPDAPTDAASLTTEFINDVAPDGPRVPPPSGPDVPVAGIPPIENRLLALAGPGKLQTDRLDQSLLRFHEAAIDTAKREASETVQKGNARLLEQGIGVRSGTSLAAAPNDIPKLDGLNQALHNPTRVATGEIKIPDGLENIYAELRDLMDWETAARLDFDPAMATIDDYFYRGWKPPADMFPSGQSSLVANPAFRKPRNGASYDEMRELGFEPLFWNPYEQWRTARLQGVRYREQMELVEALKSMGDDMIRPHETGPIPEGWRVPQVGQAFEGKPFAVVDEATGNARPMTTNQWIVRDRIANPLESMYGKKPNLGSVNVGGKDIDILKAVDWAVLTPKRAKLFGSFFQQIDFATRAGIGSWHGMVNALRTGHPIEAVKHLALYPKTVSDMIGANFRPGFRTSLKSQLKSTTPIMPDRPGIHLKGITDSGLSIADVTIFPKDMDNVVRELAQETGLVSAGKAIPRSILALEGAMRRGLFEGVYPAAIINDVTNNIAPVMARTYPDATDAQLNSMIATAANKRFSTIPASQSVVQNRALRETLRRVMFSFGESEGLLRQAVGTVKGPNRAFWIENFIGAYLFFMTVAETIHFASTGEFLPLGRFTPIAENTWGGLPIGYNRDFAAPDLPISGEDNRGLTLDVVGQMDTAFRVLHPLGFITSRESVPIRAVTNQLTKENFFGKPIDEVGPGGVASRTSQLVQDLFSPIGFGQAGSELVREQLPEGLIAEGESRIGAKGQLIQSLGINLRADVNERKRRGKFD